MTFGVGSGLDAGEPEFFQVLGHFVHLFARAEDSVRWLSMKAAHSDGNDTPKRLERRPLSEVIKDLQSFYGQFSGRNTRDLDQLLLILDVRNDILHNTTRYTDGKIHILKGAFTSDSDLKTVVYSLSDIKFSICDLTTILLGLAAKFHQIVGINASNSPEPLGDAIMLSELFSKVPWSYFPPGRSRNGR